jgi:lysophospholipase L1-like esterase
MGKRIALALNFLCMPVLLTELALRIVGSAVHDYHYEIRKAAMLLQMHDPGGYLMNPPDSTAIIEGHEMRFNSFGMRDVEPQRPKPVGICRLLIVGDSVTFGSGVRQEAIYGYRMRERLSSIVVPNAPPGSGAAKGAGAYSGGQSIDVVIAAVSGWNTLEQERFLRVNLQALEPDLVVLAYVPNDREFDNSFIRVRKEAETVGERLYRSLILHSRLFEHVAFVYKMRIAGPDKEAVREWNRWRKSQQAMGELFSQEDHGWLRSRQALLDIRSLLAERGVELIIVSYRLTSLGVRQATADALQRLSRESGLPVYDTLEYFNGRPLNELVNQAGVDVHPNAKAHGILAERLTAVLLERSLLFHRVD